MNTVRAGRCSERAARRVNITVTIMIAAPVDAVWNVIEPIERHVEWMADAVAIEFRSEQTRGVGTTFDCRHEDRAVLD